jgi:hypothetical protein
MCCSETADVVRANGTGTVKFRFRVVLEIIVKCKAMDSTRIGVRIRLGLGRRLGLKFKLRVGLKFKLRVRLRFRLRFRLRVRLNV